MPSAPTTGTIAPGVVTGTSGYPQWGVGGANGATDIKEATSSAQKTSLISQGYVAWFSSQAAAQAFQSSETSALNGSIPNPLPTFGLQLGNVKGLLTRFLKVLIGGVLIIAGVLKLTGKEDIVTKGGAKLAEGMLLA